MKIQIEDEIIKCNVQYGNRKKLSIHVDPFGYVTVKVPKNTTKEIITFAVESKGSIILERLRTIERAREIPKAREYHTEDKFLYLGSEHMLNELIETKNLDEETLKRNLKKFYMKSCQEIVAPRIKIFEKQLKVKHKSFEIVESKVKWGSCGSDRRLTFNYRLAMAPIEVVDYVVIHELCHLLHMNHDRSFWRRVGSIMPDFKEKEDYLARNSHLMSL